jgi:ubiquinone/menaquinone biosynthesis C-methylase UbiE
LNAAARMPPRQPAGCWRYDAIMTNTVERFSNRVENYAKYRPDYPAEVLGLFRDEMNLTESSVLADVGSGTGLSARLFLENGNTIFGVEPNEPMREAAEKILKDFPNFKSVDGTAENTTLPESSIDIVTAAQAFHWFDQEKTRREFKRILKDKGFAALIWNERQLESTPFLRDYERLLLEFATDYEKVRHENVHGGILRDFFQKVFFTETFLNVQTHDFEGLEGRLLSSSYMPSAEDPVYETMTEELKSLFAKYSENGKIQILYDTKVHYSQF